MLEHDQAEVVGGGELGVPPFGQEGDNIGEV